MTENKIQVYCLKYAESVFAENFIFEGGNPDKFAPISFCIYLIKSNEKYILVDAGCDTITGFKMKGFYSPAFVLRQIGFCADDITDVVITHADFDHIEAVRHFKNAIVHISKDEYERGKKYLSENKKINIFENEYDLDSQIKIIVCGGHSKGSSIVQIITDDLIHILAGDECYTSENIIKKIPTGSSCNRELSAKFIENYSKEEYCVHTCHDSSLKTERIV